MHRAGANFHIVRLLQHAILIGPELREAQNQILKIQADIFFLKFYFNFQIFSKSSLVASFLSVWCSIHPSDASRNSLMAGFMDSANAIRSNRSPVNRSASSCAAGCIANIPGRRHFSQSSPGSQLAKYAARAPNSVAQLAQRSKRGSHPPRRTVENAK